MRKKEQGLQLLVVCLGLLLFGALPATAQDLQDFEDRVTEFTLDNGLTFLVIERPVAPVISFVTYVDVGGVDEPVGHTGIAHIFEHMAFKGTHYIGTSNWKKEKEVLDKLDKTYQQWLNEKYKPQPDSTRMNRLWSEFQDLQEKAKQYVVNNEFSQVIERNGGTGLNAGTGYDQTVYFYSLPENRMELWFSLESDRFKNPVFREFYVEKEVVREERRMRTESSPVGRLVEEFLTVAYSAHPYGRPVVGWNSDITATSIEDAKEFYNTYYVPRNITIAISGDVKPDEVKRLAKSYFGDLKAGPEPPPVYTREPDQRGERRFTIVEQTQPFYLMGFHTVAQDHPDFEALRLVGSIISSGRTSRLYKRMVEEEELALAVQAFNGFPGTKYQSMFMTFAVPNRGVSLDTIETTIEEEIEKVKNGDITPTELERARTNARASLIRSLDSNSGLAQSFATAHAQRGDWRKVFTQIDDLNAVTLEDLQRVARKYLTKDNRTVGMIKNKESDEEVADASSN